MPVLDHATHPSTVMPADYRHGCFNREAAEGYWAQDGYTSLSSHKGNALRAHVKLVWIPHVMSRECRFDHSLTDPACEGCKHRGSGERYAQMVKEKAE